MAEAVQTPVQKYLELIGSYDNEFKKWEARVAKILKRYRAEETAASNNPTARFNIVWSNVQTLIPAVYARMPKADASRRFVDNDPVGRVAALLIERCLDYEIEHYSDYRSALHNCVSDRFLGGRGVSWVRYDPHVIAQDAQITEDVDDPEDRTSGDGAVAEQIDYECSPTDYVYWKDFGHTVARTWEEVGQVWRWVYMTEEGIKARFPDKWKKIPLDSGPEKLNGTKAERLAGDRAKIAELWDRETGKVYWLSKHLTEFIDECDDPLELEEFFPCAKPLYATLTTDSLVPVPDPVLYQDQSRALDTLADRIDGLIKALRVRGIYDASQPALQRLLTEGENNTLVGTDKWAAFSEKGGLKGSIDLLPLDTIAAALIQCYQAEANIKSTIYEITGISDIVRGQGAASETATAQQIKGQYAGLRLKSMQEGVAVFASELLRIKAQIICSKYQDETILAYAAAQQLSAEDQKYVPKALELIRDNPLRSFRIEVAADSLVQIDEEETKKSRLEFLNYSATFLREAIPAGQQAPEMVPAIMAMLKFGIGGFKQARTIEGTLDKALQDLQQKAVQMAANPPPNPEVVKAQAKAQADAQASQAQAQADAAMKQAELQAQGQLEQMRLAHEQQMKLADMQHTLAMEKMKLESQQRFDKWEAELKATTAVEIALIGAQQNEDGPAVNATKSASDTLNKSVGDGIQKIMDAVNASVDLHSQSMMQMGDAIKQASGPKRIIRGPDGRATGVEPVTMQ